MTDADRILSPEEAQQVVLDHVRPLGLERVPLLGALGRIMAQDVAADYDIPPCDNSAMDGYAVRFADVEGATQDRPVELEVVEDIPAGRVGQRAVGPGQASRIMTGAPLPRGADAVVRVELTRSECPGPGGRVHVLDRESRGGNVRRAGEDIRRGDTVLCAGALCGPGEIGTLATLQRAFVTVWRRPVIAILSTGDELVEIDEPLAPGHIVNCNSYALAALATAHGAVPRILPIARDTEAQIRAAVEAALAADFVVSSGGVSVGEYDYVKKVLDDLGARTVFWRVAMKPGKPLFFCQVQGKPYFGLPGNPVSSMTSFLQFVRPAIRRASGYAEDDLLLPEGRAILHNDVYNRGDRRQYLRAQLRWDDGRLLATTPAKQGSHMLSSMLGVNGFAVLEPEERGAPGAEVRVQVIGRVF
ncbi:MAG: gephyrin-like molybdotransferase Glp [Candidatus Latescibacterota bacterium]